MHSFPTGDLRDGTATALGRVSKLADVRVCDGPRRASYTIPVLAWICTTEQAVARRLLDPFATVFC